MRTEYAQPPLAAKMVSRVLGWSGIDPAGLIEPVCAKILSLACDRSTERDFRRWCASAEAPAALASFDRKWAELLFDSVVLHTYAHQRYAENVAVAKFMPLWIYDCPTEYCKSHRSVDRFVASHDDPVWQSIYPPNGWLCGCSVLAITEEGLKDELGHHHREMPQTLLDTCARWIDERPDAIYAMI